MIRKLIRIVTAMCIVLLLVACSKSNDKNLNEVSPKDTDLNKDKNPISETAPPESNQPSQPDSSLTYTTITEWFDWGPAITKVILNVGVAVDPSTLTPDAFTVSSVRSYNIDGSAPDSKDEPTNAETTERKVLKVYSSDENGKELNSGTFLTFEMEVGSEIVAGSPMNYNTGSSFCNFVDTSYIIELSEGAKLNTADGKPFTMAPTDKAGYAGNKDMIPDGFDYSGDYKQGDIEIKYSSFTPQKASQQGKTPLIVYLHGHSEGGGQDPKLAVYSNYVVNMASEEIQSYFGDTGAYLLIPQAPTFWMDYDGNMSYNDSVKDSKGKSYYTEALMGLIKEYVTTHPEIDPNKIYVGGYSNGGYMSINLITEYPDYFAAAFPSCGPFLTEWMTEEKLASIVDVPIWLSHCKKDTTVPIYKTVYDNEAGGMVVKKDEEGNEIPIYEHSNAIYDRLKKAGAKNVHYSLMDSVLDTTGRFFKKDTKDPYEYNGHFAWIPVLNNSCTEKIDGKEVTIFAWLARQSK